MAVSVTSSSQSYVGNGSWTVISLPFKFFANTDLYVSRTPSGSSIASPLVLGSDYTVTGAGADSGGQVTMTTPPASGDVITVARTTPQLQQTVLSSQGPFSPKSVTDMADRAMMIAQELANGEASLLAQVAAAEASTRAQTAPLPLAIDSYTVQAAGSVVARALKDRFAEVIDLKDFGAKGDGVTDDTASVQAALNAVPAGGGELFAPTGVYKITSTLQVKQQNTAIVGPGGGGSSGGVQFLYTPTSGALFQIGSFDADLDYSSAPAGGGLRLENLNLRGSYDATAASPPASTAIGVLDYEGGGLLFKNVTIDRFYRGVWGAASDVNHLQNVTLSRCEYGLDIRVRSDQQTYQHLYVVGCYVGVRLNGVQVAKFDRCLFVDNISDDVQLEGGSGSESDVISGSPYTSGVPTVGTQSVTLDTCWFEVYRDKFGGSAWPRGQPTKNCYVRVGYNTTLVGNPVAAVKVKNCAVIQLSNPSPAVAACFIRTQYAVDVRVDGLAFGGSLYYPVLLSEAAQVDVSGGGIQQVGSQSVRGVTNKDATTSVPLVTIAGQQCPVPSPESPIIRRSMVTNPALKNGGFGWILSSGTTFTPYSAGAGEILLGEAQTIGVNAQFHGINQQALRLRPNTAYEVVIRYKNPGANSWSVKVAPFGTGTPPDNSYVRNLAPVATFQEVRFTFVTYAGVPTAPAIELIYNGTTFTDTLVLDYLDVHELAPADSVARGPRREVFGSAAPTAGTWDVNDECVRWPATAGQPRGWTCTVAGTPGTWNAWPNL